MHDVSSYGQETVLEVDKKFNLCVRSTSSVKVLLTGPGNVKYRGQCHAHDVLLSSDRTSRGPQAVSTTKHTLTAGAEVA